MSDSTDFSGPAPGFRVLDTPLLDELTEEAGREPDVVPTPWQSVNRLYGDQGGKRGLPPGSNNLIVGLTGTGKSLCGLQSTGHAVSKGHKKDTATLRRVYQQPDPETTEEVVLGGRDLRMGPDGGPEGRTAEAES